MKKVFLCIFTMLFSVIIHSQDLPRIIPPSPEASSLAKFGEIPVSHFTGLPSINIPFYTIQQDGISIPINLSYHARGMKVAEVAPRVGMGWALNYGGSMSRQTRGKPDESSFGFRAIKDLMKGAMRSDLISGETARRTLFARYIDGYDFFPDKFMFNANGLGGNFTINYEDLEPLIKEYDDIKVSYSEGNNGIESFVITDSKGNKFYYGVSLDGTTAVNTDLTKITYIYRGLGGGGINQFGGDTEAPSINSWQLMEIITPNNSSIKFNYVLEESFYYQRSYDRYFPGSVQYRLGDDIISASVAFSGGYIAGNTLINSGMSPTGGGSNSALESYFSKVESKQYQISEIIFDTGKIDFIKSTAPREDLTNGNGPASLDRIQIKDKNNTIIKQYKFNYEYKEGVVEGNELWSLIQQDPSASKRLFLTSIQELDGLDNSNPPHTFIYNDEQIPNRHSNSQDLWGYYNGMPNGEFLTFFEYGANTNNRTVDIEKSKAGLLERIVYPTGGSTDFIYEHNKVAPSIAYGEIVTALTNPLRDRSEGLTHLDYNDSYNQATKAYEKQFEIKYVYPSGDRGINATVNFQNPNQDCNRDAQNQTNCNFSIELWKEGAFIAQLYFGDNLISHSLIQSGIHTLKVIPYENVVHDPLNPNHSFDVLLNWKEQEVDESTLLYAAGKRIKRIEHKDANNDLLSFKEYEYEDPYFGGTSGKLFGLPNFMSIHSTSGINGVPILAPTGASIGKPVSSIQGNSLGYEHVTEYYGDKNNNLGKTEYSYTVTDDVGNYFQYPYNLPTDNSWLRGKNVDTKYFRQNNNEYILEKEIRNTYMYGGIRHNSLFSSPNIYLTPNSYLQDVESNIFQESQYFQDENRFNQPLMVCHYITGGANNQYDLNYKVYHLNGGTQDLISTTHIDYFQDDVIAENKTTYFYNYSKHYQTKKVKATNSKGETTYNEIIYPQDKIGLTTAEEKLKGQHQFVPLESVSYLDENNNQVHDEHETLNSVSTQYKDWGSHNILPEKVQTAKGSQDLEDRITYHQYDDKGNPIEVSKKNGSRIYYVWGYNQTQPIAKIEGYECAIVNDPIKGETTICFTNEQFIAINNVRSASLNETNDTTETNLRVKLQELRDSFSSTNAQVTTFTYDPLIGVTSITDSRGQTIYYEYDTFNRLKFVKDIEGNILSKNEYNYKN